MPLFIEIVLIQVYDKIKEELIGKRGNESVNAGNHTESENASNHTKFGLIVVGPMDSNDKLSTGSLKLHAHIFIPLTGQFSTENIRVFNICVNNFCGCPTKISYHEKFNKLKLLHVYVAIEQHAYGLLIKQLFINTSLSCAIETAS